MVEIHLATYADANLTVCFIFGGGDPVIGGTHESRKTDRVDDLTISAHEQMTYCW